MKCYNCGQYGHFSRECPEPRTDGRRGREGLKYLHCTICGSTKHSHSECTQPFKRLENMPGYANCRTKLPSLASEPKTPLMHTPESLLEHARQYLKLEKADVKQACEKVWSAASEALLLVAGLYDVNLKGHDAKSLFVEFLVEHNNVDNSKNWFRGAWNLAQSCHSHFCGPVFKKYRVDTVQGAVVSIAEFVNALAKVKISAKQKEELREFYEEKKQKNDRRTMKRDMVFVEQ